MPEISLDHLYRETHHWDASVAWWQRLGFSFAEQWGEVPHRAGRLVNEHCVVVLAEVSPDQRVRESVFLATSDLDAVSEVTGVAIAETHWGTTMVSLTDPDGRTYNIEPGGDA
jgi:hypothetical protein